jgi:hypothetical protein
MSRIVLTDILGFLLIANFRVILTREALVRDIMLQQNYLLKINRGILNRDKHTRNVLNFVTQSQGMLWCGDVLVASGRCDQGL